MAITVSLVLLLGLSVSILHRYAGLKFWHAITCLLFGFFLATTSVAPMIRSAVSNIVAFLTGQH